LGVRATVSRVQLRAEISTHKCLMLIGKPHYSNQVEPLHGLNFLDSGKVQEYGYNRASTW